MISHTKHETAATFAPTPADQNFEEWWRKMDGAVQSDLRRGVNSLAILGAWSIWRHKNDCVFNNATPSVNSVLHLAKEEAGRWSAAGAKGISLISTRASA